VRDAYKANVEMLIARKAALEATTQLLLDKTQIMGDELEDMLTAHPAKEAAVV
jgi:ATP-dependent Zn protease